MAKLTTTSQVFTPSQDQIASSQLTNFMQFCAKGGLNSFPDQRAFCEYSIEQPEQFWRLLLTWAELPIDGSAEPVCTDTVCERAQFFPNLRLNYSEVLLAGDEERAALLACHDDAPTERLTLGELRGKVSRVAAAFQELGVVPGDRVAAIARNDAATVVACLAATAIGASFCSAPLEMGEAAILSRFGQLSPSLLLCHTSAFGQVISERVAAVVKRLPSLRGVITLDNGPFASPPHIAVRTLSQLAADSQPPLSCWARFPFDQPLFILFSSGTTGAPKCIVHGAGGTLLEHVKEHRLHCNIGKDTRLFFQTSCAWMMWNWQLSALASGAAIVLYDAVVSAADTLWQIVAMERVTHFGTSPAYLKMCQDHGYAPGRALDLRALRAVMSTGSILYDTQYDWFVRAVGDLPLQSISGGTDIIGCFVLGSPNLPVWRGEAQCISLGMDVRAFPVPGETRKGYGELVCANPFPSRPLGLFGDTDGTQFHAAYFTKHPDVWTHGDYIEITERGTTRIHGRSDGVINIRGIRIGPAEIYHVLQEFTEIRQALAVAQQDEKEPGGVRLVLLVVPGPGRVVTPDVTMQIRRTIGARLTAAHVPAVIASVPELPVTHSGKLSETAATAAVNGETPRNRQALRNPGCLDLLALHPALRQSRGVPRRFATLPADVSLEVRLTAIWEELFGIAPIEQDDDFFELGGDSLLAVTLMASIEEATGEALPISALLEARTIQGLADLVRAGPVRRAANLVQVRDGDGRPIFFLPALPGTALEQYQLFRSLITPRPLYALQAPGVDPRETPQQEVRALATAYIDAIKRVQPHGPYALVGYSFGGLVAYDMAHLLRTAGESLEAVVLLDTGIHPGSLPFRLRTGERLQQIRRRYRDLRRQGGLHFVLHGVQSALNRLRRSPSNWSASFGDEIEMPSHLQRVRNASGAAFTSYSPPYYPGEILLVHASERPEGESDPAVIWRYFAARVQVEEVAGSHFTMIEHPTVERVAAALSRRFSAVANGLSSPIEQSESAAPA